MGQSLKDSLIAEGNRYFDKSHDYWDLSNLDSCFFYTSKALNSYKKASSHDNMVKCFNGLSSLSGYEGRFQKQKEYLDSAMAYIDEDSITINAVEAHYNFAGYLESIHLLEEAESRYSLTSKLAKDLALDNLILHILHNNLSYLFLRLKNYKSAIDEIEIAINFIKEEKDLSFYHVRSLINKANIYSEVGESQKAFEALTMAKEVVLQGKKEDQAQFEYELILEEAKIHFKTKQYAKCLEKISLCDIEGLKKTSSTHYLKLLRLRDLSRIKLSLPIIKENEYLDSLFQYPHINILSIQEYFGELAMMYLKNGHITKVKTKIDKLIEKTSTFKSKLPPGNLAYQMAILNQCAYQIKIASEVDAIYSKKQLNEICTNLIDAAYQLRRISFFSDVKTEWSEKIEELLPNILKLSHQKQLSDKTIIDISELIKQRNANESISQHAKGKGSKIFQEIKALESLIAKYEEHQLTHYDENPDEENRIALSNLRKELRTKIQSFKEEHEELYNKVYVEQNVSIEHLQKQLSDEELILTYLKTENHLCVCKIDNSLSICNTKPYNPSSHLSDLFSLLENGESSLGEYKKLATKVYQQYLKPYIKDEIKKVVIIPHGTLSYLPFHALVDEDENYILEDLSFNYQLNLNLMSSTSLRRQNTIDEVNVYIDTSSVASALHCSEKEISGIKQAKVNIKTELNQLLEEHNKNRIIHVIAHASANNENLSGEISEGESMLSGLRIKNGNIESDLIILSSCDSGIGVNTLGEGVSSLNSAIFHNNIGSSISSLWKIDDCSTSEILSTFYKHISTHDKDESLRKAMLHYIKEAHPSRRHPYFWAGLVQYGNTDSISFKSTSSNKYIIGSLIISAMLFLLWLYLKPVSLT